MCGLHTAADKAPAANSTYRPFELGCAETFFQEKGARN